MAHKPNLHKCKRTQSHKVRSHDGIRISTKEFPNTWEIDMFLNNRGEKKEFTRKIGKYFQLHKNENKTYYHVCTFRCTNYTALILTK